MRHPNYYHASGAIFGDLETKEEIETSVRNMNINLKPLKGNTNSPLLMQIVTTKGSSHTLVKLKAITDHGSSIITLSLSPARK